MLTAEKAGALTSEEGVALMKKAALLADPETQADILCGLISAMTQDELTAATQTLLDAQNRGNAWSQEVWNALWTQWGRVNAVSQWRAIGPAAAIAWVKTQSEGRLWDRRFSVPPAEDAGGE